MSTKSLEKSVLLNNAQRTATALRVQAMAARQLARIDGYSPWGRITDLTQVADGITFVSTESHGGFILGNDRLALMPEAFRSHSPFAGIAHYEEDCDAPIVVLAFPECFKAADILAAANFVIDYQNTVHRDRPYFSPQVKQAARVVRDWCVADTHAPWRAVLCSNCGVLEAMGHAPKVPR